MQSTFGMASYSTSIRRYWKPNQTKSFNRFYINYHTNGRFVNMDKPTDISTVINGGLILPGHMNMPIVRASSLRSAPSRSLHRTSESGESGGYA